MKNTKPLNHKWMVLLYFYFLIFFGVNTSWSQDKLYPEKVHLITKKQADYKTPENTLAAGFSALMNNDLEWYYETLTKAAAKEDKAMFEEAGLDLNEKFKLINPGDQLIILEKKDYKEGILIHSKGITREGTIYTGPNVFVLENGLWKETFNYITDEEIHVYLDIAPPEQILSADIRLFPERWNHQWYKQMLNKKRSRRDLNLEKVSVLCLLGNLRDSDGNIRSVEEIDPETLVLNYIVKPLPWRYGSKEDMAVFINAEKPFRLPHKSFDQWKKQQHLHRNFQGPVMLIKFSKFEAINSLEDLNPEKTYTISVSGKLKDNETHFRGETQITLISSKLPKAQSKKASSPAGQEPINEQYWWNEMDE